MLGALLVFLVGCLILAVVIYVAKMLIDMMGLPAPVAQIAILILGLVCLVILLMLCLNVYNGGGIQAIHL